MPTVWRHEYAALTTLHQPPCSSFSYCLCWYSQVSHSNRSWPVTLRLTLQMSVSRLSEMLLQSSCLAGDGEKCEKERERSQFGGERSSQQLHKACLNVTTWFRCRCANSPGVSWRTLCFPFLKKSNSVAIMTAACLRCIRYSRKGKKTLTEKPSLLGRFRQMKSCSEFHRS